MKVEVKIFESAEEAIRSVRDEVFGGEQAVPPEINWDGRDRECYHVLACDESGRPIGTGRLSPEGKIGRLAVLADSRQQGVGGALVEKLLEVAMAVEVEEVFLHAQVHAVTFYEKRGFEARGDFFQEAEIEHRLMVRTIDREGA